MDNTDNKPECISRREFLKLVGMGAAAGARRVPTARFMLRGLTATE